MNKFARLIRVDKLVPFSVWSKIMVWVTNVLELKIL
jgi:hypothetical protein